VHPAFEPKRKETRVRVATLSSLTLFLVAAAGLAQTPPANPTPADGRQPTSSPADSGQSDNPVAAPADDAQTRALEAEMAAALAADTSATAPVPAPVVTASGNKSFLNLSLDGLFVGGTSTADDVAAIETGGHDPAQRGFTVQNIEVVLDGAVDPYFRGQANLIFQLTPEGETNVELEEAYVTTTSLPAGLQLKVGQFFTELGRLNPSHPHAWDYVDQPLVNARLFGGDGLRSTGARLSWLVPTPFYSELFLTVQNNGGETLTSFRSVEGESLFGHPIVGRTVKASGDLLWVPRYSASFDLSDTQTLLVGASAALGPNGTGDDGRTRIYGVDGFWKWKPTNAFNGFPFFKLQTEIMQRDLHADGSADLAPADYRDWGGYLQASWGFRPRWVVGLRGERVGGDQGLATDGRLAARTRLSPVLTFYPSEFSKLRLQYNFDHGNALAQNEHSLWLQLEFLLGAHGAHKY
jgi:hypothetical protein